MDATVYYREMGDVRKPPGVIRKLRGVEMVSVMEVMSDRWEGRQGAWGVFGVVEGDGEGGEGIADVK